MPRPKAIDPTQEAVCRLIAYGRTTAEIARALGVSPRTVRYHKQRLAKPDSKVRRPHGWDEIQTFYDEGHSRPECQLRFGISARTWQKAVKRGAILPRADAMPLAQLLVDGVTRDRSEVKRHLLEAGLKRNRCEKCGISTWLGEPLSLAVHHGNGDPTDNRLENLSLLCPICHGQRSSLAVRSAERRHLRVVEAPDR